MGDQERKGKEARIRRLRERVGEAQAYAEQQMTTAAQIRLCDALKGVLDLLGDEL